MSLALIVGLGSLAALTGMVAYLIRVAPNE